MNDKRWHRARLALASCLFVVAAAQADGGTIVHTFGDMDLLNQSSYPSDPTAGATLFGLAPDAVTFATNEYVHENWPFSPEPDEFTGTDAIYAGAFNYVGGDGYSNSPERTNGFQQVTVDYAFLIPLGDTVTSLTLGIAADDFQFPTFGNEFLAGVNALNPALSVALNSLDQTGPRVRFLTIGLDPAILRTDHTLTLLIAQGDTTTRGDPGPGDGWAIDFLTVGIETVPGPAGVSLGGLVAIVTCLRRRVIPCPLPSGSGRPRLPRG